MKRLRLNQILAILILSMVFNLGGDLLGSYPEGVTAETIVNIEIMDNRFSPQNQSVSAGSTVVWTNNGNLPHTATSDTGLWDSGTLLRGQTFSRTFDTPGAYPYNCVFHRGAGMVGTITVIAPTSPTATSTRAPAPPTATALPTATITPVLPTATSTPAPPTATATALSPTATPTSTQPPATATAVLPTSTPTSAPPTATSTSLPPMAVPTPVPTKPTAILPTPAPATPTGPVTAPPTATAAPAAPSTAVPSPAAPKTTVPAVGSPTMVPNTTTTPFPTLPPGERSDDVPPLWGLLVGAGVVAMALAVVLAIRR